MRISANPSKRRLRLFRTAVLASLSPLAVAAALAQARVVQALEAFYSPSAVAVAPDGRTLYVTNAARGESGMIAGRGAVSKVLVQDSGELRVDQVRFADGLNAPSSLVVLPGATGAGVPAGFLAVTVGGSWTVDTSGKRLAASDAGTGVAFIDATTGSVVGRIYLGKDSPLETATGAFLQDPSAITADQRGNLYVADMAGAGTYVQSADYNPGVFKLAPDAVSALAKGEAPPPGTASFVPEANVPMALYYDVAQDALYWATGNGVGDLGGAVFRLPGGDFSGATPLETVDKRLGSIAAMTRTPRGSLVCARNAGDLVIVRKRGKAKVVQFKKIFSFLSPGMFAAVEAGSDKRCLLVVPELSGGGLGPWRQRLQVVELQGGF